MFRKVQGRLYGALDLKPVLYQDVRHLQPSEVRLEEMRRNSLLKEVNRQTFVIISFSGDYHYLVELNMCCLLVCYRMRTLVCVEVVTLQPGIAALEDCPLQVALLHSWRVRRTICKRCTKEHKKLNLVAMGCSVCSSHATKRDRLVP